MGEQLFYLSFDEFREWGVVGVKSREGTNLNEIPGTSRFAHCHVRFGL